ncbi:MAG: TonB-dependent receptor [Vicinamibacterales bacterium]
MPRTLSRVLIRILLLVLTLAPVLSAQSFQGGVRGTLKDAQGIIPGATIVLRNPDTGVARETITNESGEYAFPAVDPSTYTVKVDVPGFAPYANPNVRVGTQSFITLDITLSVGNLQEDITVTGSAPLIETTNASQGGTIDVKDMQEIPSEGRSVFLMATLQPTVVASGNARWNRMQDQTGNSALSMGGGAVRANNFLIDGFPTTDLQNRSSVNPSMEALQDSRVQIHTYDAEMGRTGGGVMNMTARSGGNRFAASGYTVVRPKSLQEQFLVPRLLGQPFLREGWQNGGGAVGGPILKNKTFFWFAGEAYTNDQPQAAAFSVPSMQTRLGDFSQLTRNGQPFYIRDPLSNLPCSNTAGGAGCFPGNVIPANRLNPTGLAIAGYMPEPDVNVDNGSQNFSRTVILPNTAYQYTLKVNHNVSAANQLSGFYLRQVTNENSANYNPVYKFVGSQYLLKRANHTIVLNDTWVLNPSTVLSVRGGWNQFLDNNELPESFDASSLWKDNPGFTGQFTDGNRFPTTSLTGYRGTGWTNRSNNTYYQYGGNGSLSKLAGTHSLKAGAEYRVLGLESFSYGASTGSYTFDGRFTGNALADMLLGYPGSGNIPVSAALDGYIRYAAAFVQDDWRISDRLTLNYGLRLEHETNLQERNNRITTDFAMSTLSPLNNLVNVIDPITGQRRDIYGGLVFAGENGAPTQQGGTRPPQVSPRVGVVYTIAEGLVLRGGWGTYVSPWNYPAAGTSSWAQYGYSATTTLQQSSSGVPITSLSNPFPGGILQPTGSSLGMLTNVGQATNVFLPNKGTPKAQQYSVDVQKELRGGIMVGAGYTGLTGSDLSYQTTININQLDPKYQTMGINTLQSVPNPFYGVAQAGGFASRQTIELGQLLRPFPQFGDLLWTGATGARSQYHALILQGRKRTDKYWGVNVNYTFSRLNDNQVGASNYYSSSPGVQNNYVLMPWSSYYNPDAEYSRSLLDSPHKLTIAPTVMLPFGEGKKWLQTSRIGNALLGGWSITAVSQFQSGFPVGVSQNVNGTQFLFGGAIRPNLVPDVPILADGNITSRIEANPTDNQYFNLAAFQAVPINAFGNAPRTLPGVLSPRRTSFSMSAAKQVDLPGRASLSLRVELLNPLNIVQWQAPASVAFGNSNFGQLRDQANTMRSVQFTLRLTY